MTEQQNLCLEEIRRHDHDRYLTVLFAPSKAQEALAALYAFNLEIARTSEIVSEPMLGQIRLQWWRETIDGIYRGNIRAHYVSEPLQRAIQERNLTRHAFERLIDARERDLEDFVPESLTELEEYLSDTAAPLVELAVKIVRPCQEVNSNAVKAVATAYGLIGIVRSIPFHVRRRRCLVPLELLKECGLSKESLFRGRNSLPLKDAVEPLVARAEYHMMSARHDLSRLPKAARSPYLLGTLAKSGARRLRKARFNPYDSRIMQASPMRAWLLLWASLSGRIV